MQRCNDSRPSVLRVFADKNFNDENKVSMPGPFNAAEFSNSFQRIEPLAALLFLVSKEPREGWTQAQNRRREVVVVVVTRHPQGTTRAIRRI